MGASEKLELAKNKKMREGGGGGGGGGGRALEGVKGEPVRLSLMDRYGPAPGISSDWSILTIFVNTHKARDMRHSCQSALSRKRFTRAISRKPSYVVLCKNVSRIFQK